MFSQSIRLVDVGVPQPLLSCDPVHVVEVVALQFPYLAVIPGEEPLQSDDDVICQKGTGREGAS